MAKKKQTDTEQQTAEPVRPSEVKKMPSARVLKSLIKDGRILQEELAEKRGDYGAAIKNAVENHNLHKRAFAIAKGFDKMEGEKLVDLYDHLQHYMEVLGLNTRMEVATKRMNFDSQQPEDTEEDTEDDTNVSRFPAAAAAE